MHDFKVLKKCKNFDFAKILENIQIVLLDLVEHPGWLKIIATRKSAFPTIYWTEHDIHSSPVNKDCSRVTSSSITWLCACAVYVSLETVVHQSLTSQTRRTNLTFGSRYRCFKLDLNDSAVTVERPNLTQVRSTTFNFPLWIFAST